MKTSGSKRRTEKRPIGFVFPADERVGKRIEKEAEKKKKGVEKDTKTAKETVKAAEDEVKKRTKEKGDILRARIVAKDLAPDAEKKTPLVLKPFEAAGSIIGGSANAGWKAGKWGAKAVGNTATESGYTAASLGPWWLGKKIYDKVKGISRGIIKRIDKFFGIKEEKK